MRFDGLVLIAYFFGIVLIILATLLRYSVGVEKLRRITRWINAIKIVDPRDKTLHAFGMLIQITGLLWLLFGTGYGIVQRRFSLTGILEGGFIFLVFLSPCILLIGAVAFLRRFFWQRQK